MVLKRILPAFAVVAAIALVAWALAPAPLDVDATRARVGPMQVSVDDVGETRSHDRLVLSAPVAGRLARIDLHDGDAVAENQVVARIAPLPLARRELDELTARVAAAEALQREAEQRVRHADEDLAQARRELERSLELVQKGFTSPQAAEQARNIAASAASEAESARFRARAAAADVRAVQAGLRATRSAGSGEGGLVPILAPMSGRILRINDPSERVVAAGTPLMSIGDLANLEIVIEMLSSDAVKVAPGMPVRVDGWGGDRTLPARVRRVEPHAVTKVSALGIEEKRVNVIADFLDPPGAIGDGYRVTARVITWESGKVLKVPVSALFSCERGWCVFVVEDGRAHRRGIELGQRNPVEAEVTAGIREGERVIRFPGNAVGDGSRVRVRADD